MKVILHDDFGGDHDITEATLEMYGWTKNVSDNGSGWLELEEELRLLETGLLLGIETPEDIEKRLGQERLSLEAHERIMRDADTEGRYYQEHMLTIREKKEFVKALEKLKEEQVKTFQMTDDVTNFDEEGE